MNYYAIGMKGWVEIRKAAKEPIPRKSSAKIPGKKLRYDDWTGQWRSTNAPFVLAVTIYTGGETVVTLKSESVTRRLGIRIPPDSCLKLTKDQTLALVGKKEIKP
jgi:hypothetical protein